MKRAQLRTVMRIRELQERSARGVLALAQTRHREAVEDEEATWARVDAFGTVLRADVLPADLQQQRLVAEVGALAAQSLRQVTLDAADEAARAQVDWTAAARRVEALERLAERLAEREAFDAAHRAQTEIEDLVLARRAVVGSIDDLAGGVEP